jgi:glycosyltransferase involved in cell wall biosynthesis
MGSKRLRVAHILPWPTVGGTEHGVLRLAGSLDPTRFESVAYCVANGNAVGELFESAGIETVSYPPVEPSFRTPLPHLRAAAEVSRDLRRRSIDVVHCADLLAAYHVGLAARLAGTFLVSHVRCSYPRVSTRDRQFLRPVQQWVFVSRSTWREFGVHVTPARGSVVYDAAEMPAAAGSPRAAARLLRDLGVPEDARIVGMVARVAPIKDYETLARAAWIVLEREPRAHFLIVGDHSGAAAYAEHYRHVRGLLRELDLERHFTFTGHREDVGSFIRQFEVAVLVTHSEGLPLVLLEAIRLGKPVVATAVGGIPELVRDGETGLLHGHRDWETLANAILDLLNNPARAARLAASAADAVEREFSRTAFSKGITEVYERRYRRAARPAHEGLEKAEANAQ